MAQEAHFGLGLSKRGMVIDDISNSVRNICKILLFSPNFHASWWKRKWDNEERDKEKYKEWKRKDEEDKSHKKAQRPEQLRAAQSKQWNKLKKAAMFESKNVIEQDSSVSLFLSI